MIRLKRFIWLLAISTILGSCEGEFTPSDEILALQSILLNAPPDSEVCNATFLQSGRIEVTFIWNIQGEYTGSFDLILTSNDTETVELVIGQQANVELEPGTRYTWTVRANEQNIAADQVFTFVTPGLPEESYPPFLSDISFLAEGGNSYQLDYLAIDPDGDAIRYDVYLDVVNPPAQRIATDITNTQISTGPLPASTTHFIKVVAKDGTGNETSSSRSYTTE